MRYHVETMLDPEYHPGLAAFDADTVGIVDNAQGGVILYCHVDSVEHIMGALLWQDQTRPEED